MPRKKRTHEPSQSTEVQQGIYWLPPEATWGGFVNVRLDDEQKQAFYTWLADNNKTVPRLLDDVLGEGMKVGISYDRENQCYIVTFTGALVGGSNERYCATTRASTLDECLGLSIWKQFVLADGDYADYLPSRLNFRSWG